MKYNISVGGHAWTRLFFYTKNNEHFEVEIPGGAAMLATILKEKTSQIKLSKTPQREHLNLETIIDNKVEKHYAGRHAGWTYGDNYYQAAASKYVAIVDEGFGEIDIPKNANVFWASSNTLPSKKTIDKICENGFLMLDVDVLRKAGAMISRQVSWENSATDLVWQIANNVEINYLCKVNHILITFAEDGAIYITKEKGDIKPKLTLSHGGSEGTLRSHAGGNMEEAWLGMVAMAVDQFPSVASGKADFNVESILKVAEKMMKAGYEMNVLENKTFDSWIKDIPDTSQDYTYNIPVTDPALGADIYYWRISNESKGRKIADIAFEYVQRGKSAIEGMPQLTFGGLTTVDRKEIESFQNIKNLILEYANTKASRPLSIAVFGAPGSGKSFGVTQIAKTIMPGAIEKLEFNVSQFTDESDLSTAFHKVRDCILEGKLPLVFFDEFDSDKDGLALGWIKKFLMPMQDGKFKDLSGEHPVGKCIFVFAGGTASSFEDFCAPMLSENDEEKQSFKNVKGPDFVSRLRGTINVFGPNPTSHDDYNFILRRALLLRSLCERKLAHKSGDLPVNDDVIRAMLLVPKYKHGARSMEAILDMSRIEGPSWEPASLPFYTQLALHTDADVFIRLVLNDVRINSFNEKLATAIHEDFLQKQKEAGKTGPFTIPWEDLPEDIKDNNRNQASMIPLKLEMINCSFDSGDAPYKEVEEFHEDEIMMLAMFEHERWMKDKAEKGYIYGKVRNDDKNAVDANGNKIPLTHPDMVEWSALSDEEKKKDEDTVLNIIPLLKSAGLRVYRTV